MTTLTKCIVANCYAYGTVTPESHGAPLCGPHHKEHMITVDHLEKKHTELEPECRICFITWQTGRKNL